MKGVTHCAPGPCAFVEHGQDGQVRVKEVLMGQFKNLLWQEHHRIGRRKDTGLKQTRYKDICVLLIGFDVFLRFTTLKLNIFNYYLYFIQTVNIQIAEFINITYLVIKIPFV